MNKTADNIIINKGLVESISYKSIEIEEDSSWIISKTNIKSTISNTYKKIIEKLLFWRSK